MDPLVDALIACGAVKFGRFKLASGATSDYYVDIKKASTDPNVLRLMGEGLGKRVGGAQRIAGMELGAVPLAAAASLASGVPYLMVRKKAKEHGTASRIEGPFAPGEECVVVEDVTDALQQAGVKVASPTRRAAEVEWSKAFMRDLLEKHQVPGRVKYRTFR